MNQAFSIARVLQLAVNDLRQNAGYFIPLTLVYTTLQWLLGALQSTLPQFLVLVLSVLVYAKYATAVHRAILQRDFSPSAGLRWDASDGQYFALLIGFYLAAVLLAAVLIMPWLPRVQPGQQFGIQDINPAALVMITAVVGYLVARFSLVLPAVAVKREYSLARAWADTQNHGLSLMALTVGVPMLAAATLIWVLPADALIWQLLRTAVMLLATIFQVVALSHCFALLASSDGGNDRGDGDDDGIESRAF